jgi:hypothetical protein
MKPVNFSFLLAILITFLLTGCSSISVHQDYDPEYDFSKLKNFGFLPIPEEAGIDQLNAARLGEAIKTNLTAKGYTVSENADFGVAVFFSSKTKTNIQSYGYGYGYGYWYGAGVGDVQVTQYEQGTLIIDIIDLAKQELVWRGTGTGAMKESPNIEQRTERINKAVKSILAQFPPEKSDD